MLKLASDQHKAKSLLTLPVFLACVVSHEDEFSDPLIKTIETLTAHWRNKIRNCPHFSDVCDSTQRLTGLFRASLKDAVMCSTANGFGHSLAAAGRPNVNMIRAADFSSSLAPWEVAPCATELGL